MLTLRQFGFSSLWLLAGRLAAQMLAFIFVAITARSLGPQGFGQFGVIAALVLLGNAVTTFGTDTLVIRVVARAGAITPTVSASLALQLLLSVIWIAATALAGWILPVDSFFRVALVGYSLSLIPWALFTVSTSVLRGIERMELFVASMLGMTFLQVLAAAMVVRFQLGLIGLCVGLSLAQLTSALWALWLCNRFTPGFRVDFAPGWKVVLALARMAYPMALIVAMTLLSQRLAIFVLSIVATEVSTGLFAASARLVEGMKLMHYAAFGALLPIAARLTHQRWSTAALTGGRFTFIVILVLSLSGALIITLLADQIVLLTFGTQFLAAANVLKVLIWVLIPYSVSAYLAVIMVANGAESALARATAVSLLISVVIYGVACTIWAEVGAAWATVAAESLLAIALGWWAWRRMTLSVVPEATYVA